jgi:hypothetical protein
MNFYKLLLLKSMKEWKYIVLISLVLTLSSIVGESYVPKIKDFFIKAMTISKSQPLIPNLPNTELYTKTYCEPIKEYIIKTDDILAMGNVIVLELDTFELFKEKNTSRGIGKYYRRKGSKFEYYTVFEK